MKYKRILAGLIALACSSSVQAGVSTRLGDDVSKPMQLNVESQEVVPASCSCEGAGSCDVCNPMQLSSCDPCGKGLFGKAGCDSGSCDALGGCSSGLLGLGLIKQSEHCFDDFISPMTNPVYFEDPRQLTEVRAIFINHKLPVILGNPAGRIQVWAVQARVRLTDRLSLIAVKDGYIESQSPLIQDGYADITPGLKYSLYRDQCAGQMLSIGGRFETTAGRRRSLQGNGDGVFDFFLSGGSRIGCKGHYLSSAGFILPVDSQAENQMFYWSHHLDRQLNKKLYAFTELNWFNYMKDANAFPALEGGDFFNLGANGVKGNDIVTSAFGLKLKPRRNIESGVAWEFPLTERRGVLDNRLTADFIIRY